MNTQDSYAHESEHYRFADSLRVRPKMVIYYGLRRTVPAEEGRSDDLTGRSRHLFLFLVGLVFRPIGCHARAGTRLQRSDFPFVQTGARHGADLL